MAQEKPAFVRLQTAAFEGNVADLKACLAEGINPDEFAKGTKDKPPLTWAVRHHPQQTPAMLEGKLECVQILIDSCASLTLVDWRGMNVLHYAAEENMPEALAILIPAFKAEGLGLDIGANNQYTALHFAALYRNKEIMLKLVGEGADINAVEQYHGTPMQIAISKEARQNMVISQEQDLATRKDLFITLYLLGADHTIPDNKGVVPLQRVPVDVRRDLEKTIREKAPIAAAAKEARAQAKLAVLGGDSPRSDTKTLEYDSDDSGKSHSSGSSGNQHAAPSVPSFLTNILNNANNAAASLASGFSSWVTFTSAASNHNYTRLPTNDIDTTSKSATSSATSTSANFSQTEVNKRITANSITSTIK